MKFFKPQDFNDFSYESDITKSLSDFCNEKIERGGKVVYGSWFRGGAFDESDVYKLLMNCKSALLINIEPIEKCTHPVEKVLYMGDLVGVPDPQSWRCECGARVKPKEFVSVEPNETEEC